MILCQKYHQAAIGLWVANVCQLIISAPSPNINEQIKMTEKHLGPAKMTG